MHQTNKGIQLIAPRELLGCLESRKLESSKKTGRPFFVLLLQIDNLETYAAYGVTSTTSMGTDLDIITGIRDEIDNGSLKAPRLPASSIARTTTSTARSGMARLAA